MKKIHISIGSTMSRPGEVTVNLKQIADFAIQAADVGADFLLTPELSASGYGSYPEVLATAERAGDGPIHEILARLAGNTGVVITAGFIEAAEDRRYLAHYAVYPDGLFVVQRKNYVMPAERPLDSAIFFGGRGGNGEDPPRSEDAVFNFFDVKGVRCGMAICADIGIDGVDQIFERHGVELLLAPAGAGGRREDRVTTADLLSDEGREKYLKILEQVFFPGERIIHCMKRRMAFAAVNLCGYDGQRFYHVGHGSIINPMGEVVALFHGLPNLDRQRPLFTHAVVDVEDRLP